APSRIYTLSLHDALPIWAEAERTGLDFAIDYALLSKAAAYAGIRAIGSAQDAIRTLENRGASPHVRANLAMVKARVKIAAGDLEIGRASCRERGERWVVR